jgi:uncharacterized delta-60 repeat protein
MFISFFDLSQPHGSLFRYVRAAIGGLSLVASSLLCAAPGDLDISFGTGGKAVIGMPGSAYSDLTTAALLPDRKILVAGSCSFGSTAVAFCLARLDTDGVPDISFNQTGKVVTPPKLNLTGDRARSVVVQADGNIVLSGLCERNGTEGTTKPCVRRYLPTGVLDSAFGVDGLVDLPIEQTGGFFASALQPDGKLVAVGNCSGFSGSYFCLARLNTDGTLDAQFGSLGVASISFPSAAFGTSVGILADGRILIGGYCLTNPGIAFCAARLNANGSSDLSFGNGNGFLITTNPQVGLDRVDSLAVQPDQNFLLAGDCYASPASRFCIARYHSAGTLDEQFRGGKFAVDIGNTTSSRAKSALLQADGRILVGGDCTDQFGRQQFCVLRLEENGNIDTSFGENGVVRTYVSSGNARATTLLLQPDGKILAAGACPNSANTTGDFCLARYTGGSFIARNCKLDLDGDGRIFGTTDGLLLTRVALGMSGNAVFEGVQFAPNATRKTWPLLREFLVSQCEMTVAP